MKQLALIAWKEFGDRFTSGWVIACALVWLCAIGLTSHFGLVQIGKIGLQGYDRTVASLLTLVQYLVPLLALLLGHDLVVSEREDRTLLLVLAGGLKRGRLLFGKFIGGSITLALPLVLGFAVAGTIIGLASNPAGLGSFLKLAVSGLVLGLVFLGIGLLISCLSRARVQALVLALLAWCAAVFVFDLVAMGLVITTNSATAAREVETVTDATHVNAVADMHAAFENGDDAAARSAVRAPRRIALWVLVNPVDIFRTLNLPGEVAPPLPLPATAAALSIIAWLAGALGAATWKFNRLDL